LSFILNIHLVAPRTLVARTASPLAPPKLRPYNIMSCKKGKAVPLEAWTGPESSRKLRFPDFVTTAQDGGKAVSLTHRPLLPQEILLVLISVRG